MICVYYPSLVSATLLGVGRRGGLSSRLFPANTDTVGSWPLFFFTRFISIPWIFACAGSSVVSNLDNRLRYLLRYWGYFSFLMYPTFLEGVAKFSGAISDCSCASWLLCTVRSLLWYLLLLPVLRVSYHSSGGASFWGLSLVPQFTHDGMGSEIFGGTALLRIWESSPWLLRIIMEKVAAGCLIVPEVQILFRGYPKFLEGLIHYCKQSPGKFAPLLMFSLSHDGEGLYRLFPFSLKGFWFIRISSCSVRRRG